MSNPPKKQFPTFRKAKIDPSDLIPKPPTKVSDIDSLFLVFGMAHNDIKTVRTLFLDFLEKYEAPTEVGSHAGEYYGTKLYLEKILIAHTHEVLKLIYMHIDLIQSDEFQKYTSNMSEDSVLLWEVILAFSNNDRRELSKDQSNTLNLLGRIRHNVAFHYYQSAQNLIKGFRYKFYELPPTEDNAYAQYSIQLTEAEVTRFFYADAALEGYLKESVDDVGEREKVYNDMIKLAAMVNRCLCDLLNQYLKTKTPR